MGFEIPIDTSFPGHRKTVDLKTRLKDSQGDVWPFRLWCWAATNARDGKIRVHRHTLEAAIGWSGDRLHPPGRLFKALKDAGFIEADGVTIHDWMDGIGRAIFLYECKKQKQRSKYAEKEGFRKASGSIPPILERRGEDKRGEEGGGKFRPPPGSASPPEPPGAEDVYRRLKDSHVTGSDRQLRQHAAAWVTAEGPEGATKILDSAAFQGRDILWISDTYFTPKGKPKALVSCDRCQGSGSYVIHEFSPSANQEILKTKNCDHRGVKA